MISSRTGVREMGKSEKPNLHYLFMLQIRTKDARGKL
jgi:hypothetical protein